MPQYQGVWTLEQQAQAQSNQQWVTDPNFKNTTLLLQADGTGSGSQNQTFLDGSTNNFFITRNGNTTQGSFSPFSQAPGYWGNYFNGSSAFTNNQSVLMSTSTSTFTIEAWVYMTAAPTSGGANRVSVLSDGDQSSTTYWGFGVNSSNQISWFWYSGSSNSCTGNTIIGLNTWTHIAISVSSNTINMFVNGVLQTLSGTTTLTNRAGTTFGDTGIAFSIAKNYASALTGYISNLRFISGTSLYSSTFTPTTTPLTAVSGTVLLTCQSNRFVDNSTSVYTLTTVGTPSVQSFGPFAPALQWTPDVVGGSGYFDGTGDYLNGPNASGGDFSTGDFTISCWFYPTTLTGGTDYGLIAYADTGGWNGWQLQASGTNKNIKFEFLTGSSGASTITGGSIALNAWNYVAIVRSGSTVSMYVNSTTAATSTTNSTAYGAATSRVIVGADRLASSAFIGYISNSKLVKQANAPASIPTAPDTNTTNTSLLLNYTNAGIYDGKMANNLETVGNAQVATSPVKYGSGSMYFSGVSPFGYLKGNANLGQSVALAGDFTVECWVWLTADTSDNVIMDTRPGSNAGNYFLFYLWTSAGSTKPVVAWYTPAVGYIVNSGGAVPANAWTHVAVSRANGVMRSFINGVVQQTAANTTAYANPGAPYPNIGASYAGGGSDSFKGYIDDFRITNGVARYIANFTPPQQALPRQ
jgi:hypothetical protein